MSEAVILSVILALIFLEILFQLLVLKFSLPIFEHRPPIGAELFPPVPDAEQVTIVTKDGVTLAGSLIAARCDSPRGVILFCHELDSNRWSAMAYCEGLLAAGFHVFTFDFRNQGDSQSYQGYHALHWPSELEVADALAAADFIGNRPDLARLPLGVFGISRGGGVALAAAAHCAAAQKVASDGAYCCNEMLLYFTNRWGRLYFPDWLLRLLPKWHVQVSLWLIRRASELRRGFRYANVERALSQLRDKRVLMISGERDTYAFPESTRSLHARTGQDDATVWIVPAAKHNMARQSSPDEYDRRLVEFFSAPAPVSKGMSSADLASTNLTPVNLTPVNLTPVNLGPLNPTGAASGGDSSAAQISNYAASNSAVSNNVALNNSGTSAVNGNGRPVLVGNRSSLYSSD